jgi:hypothetical protein
VDHRVVVGDDITGVCGDPDHPPSGGCAPRVSILHLTASMPPRRQTWLLYPPQGECRAKRPNSRVMGQRTDLPNALRRSSRSTAWTLSLYYWASC